MAAKDLTASRGVEETFRSTRVTRLQIGAAFGASGSRSGHTVRRGYQSVIGTEPKILKPRPYEAAVICKIN